MGKEAWGKDLVTSFLLVCAILVSLVLWKLSNDALVAIWYRPEKMEAMEDLKLSCPVMPQLGDVPSVSGCDVPRQTDTQDPAPVAAARPFR